MDLLLDFLSCRSYGSSVLSVQCQSFKDLVQNLADFLNQLRGHSLEDREQGLQCLQLFAQKELLATVQIVQGIERRTTARNAHKLHANIVGSQALHSHLSCCDGAPYLPKASGVRAKPDMQAQVSAAFAGSL